MNKFKIGDKVKRVKNHYRDDLQIGSEGVVTSTSDDGLWLSVNNNGKGYNPHPCSSDNFELIETEETQTQHLWRKQVKK